ncbi:MAG: FG-GAP-like repeat-containing protein [Chloroflexota bacterium]
MHSKTSSAFILSIVVSLVLVSCAGQAPTTQSSSSTKLPPQTPTHPPTTPPELSPTKSIPINTAIPKCPIYRRPQQILNVVNNKRKDSEPMLLTGDFNSDGLDDVLITWSIWGDEETFKFEILLNNGNGSLYLGTSDLLAGEIPELQGLPAIPMVVEDFNADGKNDLFLAIGGLDTDPFPGYQNVLLLSNADGRLENSTGNIPQQNDGPHSVTSADVDHDGDIDIYVGNVGGLNQIDPQLLLNDGKGVFAVADHLLPPQLGQTQNQYTASEFVDVNNDSFPDLVLGESADDWLRNAYSISGSIVLVNDGNGKFILSKNAIPKKLSSTWLALDIVAADLNSDNYQDLIIVYSRTEPVWAGRFFQLLINNQDGTFTDETEIRMPNSSDPDRNYIYWLDLVDIDNDGDLDLIARNWTEFDPDPFLFENNGSGYFSQTDLEVGLDSIYYTILDIDGDGGHDFVYANYGASAPVFLIHEDGCTQSDRLPLAQETAPVLTETPESTATVSTDALLFRDEFEDELSAGWEWIGEDPTHWNLSEEPGALRIILQPGSISGEPKNFLVRKAPNGNFEISTFVHFLPQSNFQFAGLLIYQSQGNAIQFGRAFAGIGNAIYFDHVERDAPGISNFATAVKSEAQAYLRLRREGTTYTGYFSENGTEWVVIGTYESNIIPFYVGLIASQAFAGETTADFDYFTVELLP